MANKTKYNIVIEGKARVAVPKYSGRIVSSEMPVFYNPVMKSNRDITIALMAAAAKLYKIRKWRIADPMAATGVRGIRAFLELDKKSIETVMMNDASPVAVNLIKKNLQRNKLREDRKVVVANSDANVFLLTNMTFNYIDIDPFGYPGPYLDAAVKRITNKGILAVTATDTSALAGAALAACRRKYLATPLKNSFMHETGVRILIRLVQLFGAVNEKALQPVYSYNKEHYTRAFFMCRSGAKKVDEILDKHKEILYCKSCCERKIKESDGGKSEGKCGNCGKRMETAGPLWTGKLFNAKLAAKMALFAEDKAEIDEKTKVFVKIAAAEAKAEGKCSLGFYATEELCEKYKIGKQPKTDAVINELRKLGKEAEKTSFSTTGFRTNAAVKEIIKAIMTRTSC